MTLELITQGKFTQELGPHFVCNSHYIIPLDMFLMDDELDVMYWLTQSGVSKSDAAEAIEAMKLMVIV